MPNLPTEEVFVCPDWRRTEGTVRSTRPLQLGGTIVRDLEMRFEHGDAVEVRASSGADAVRGQMSIDEYGKRLGEVALVDGESRVGQTGITFYDTLFDENATCHIAYGAGVTFGIDGLDGLSPDQLRERGDQQLGDPHRLHDRRPGGLGRRDHAGRQRRADPAGGRMAAVDERLERYAELAVRVGANVEEGQTVFIGAMVEHAPFARALTRAAYGAGARYVDVRYGDQHVRRAMIEFGPDDALEHTPDWLKTRFQAHERQRPARARPAIRSPT